MRKRGKKLVAMALATSMALSTVSMQAFADESVVETSSNATVVDGVTTNQTVTTTTTTDSETGNVTVKVEITENTSGTNKDGAVVDGTMSSVKETTTDSEGTVLEETYEEDGKKTVVTEEDVAVGDEGQPEVKVELKPGETVTSEPVKGEIVKVEDSLVIDGENYNSKEVISEIEKVVQATLSKEYEVRAKENGTIDLNPVIAPEKYEGKHYGDPYVLQKDANNNNYVDPNGLIGGTRPDYGTDMSTKPAEGFDYQLSGYGDATDAASPVFMNIVYVKDPETGEAMKDANGNFIIDEEKSTLVNAGYIAGKTGMNSQTLQIVVKNEQGEHFYTYCVDHDTPTQGEHWYKVANLEDSDYYSDEHAKKIRAIVENGYWGTDATVYERDADGNFVLGEDGKKIAVRNEDGSVVVDAKTTGSLAKMKELLKNSYTEDATVTVTNAEGEDVSYNIHKLIDGLKEHEALAVTQGAIWCYANGGDVMDGKDGVGVVGAYSTIKFYNSDASSALKQYARDYDLESDARMQALFDCLIGLEGQDATDVVVNETNSVKDIDLVVGDKAILDVEDTRNTDDNPDNDVYSTSVEFTLAFVPAKDDSISVYVLDAAGNVMKDAKGNDIVRKLVAEGSEEEGAIKAKNGVYTLDGLVFEENTSVEFSLQLRGMQHLDQGVYIYQAYGGRGASQTLVGLAEGEKTVNVTKSMELTFNVDEKKKVTATTTWHEENEYTSDPEQTTPPSDPTTPPSNSEPNEPSGNGGGSRDPQVAVETFEIEESEVPLSDGVDVLGAFEIEDDMIPLGVLPATGDNSLWLMIVSLFSGLSLAGASFVDKMKKRRR